MRRLAILVLCATVLTSCGSSAPLRVSTEVVDGYRVVYRVVEAKPDAKSTSTEVVEVRRPYGGRVETRPDGETTHGQITSREHFWQLGEEGELQFGVLRPPGPPTRSVSIQAMRDAARAGRAQMRGSDTVLGRTCRWFAYREPAPKPVLPATRNSRVESCIDGDGIVLREIWTLSGTPARILEAVELDTDSPSKKRFMEGKDPASTKVANAKGAEFVETQTRVVDAIEGQIETPFSFSKPKGWTRDRVSIVASTAGRDARPTQFLSQAFLRDGELVVVETGSGPQFAPPWPTDEGRRIAIGVGEGRVVYGTDRVEIRVLSAIGYARVIATSEALARTFIERLGD